jgi:hypothetical protein
MVQVEEAVVVVVAIGKWGRECQEARGRRAKVIMAVMDPELLGHGHRQAVAVAAQVELVQMHLHQKLVVTAVMAYRL